MMPIEIRTASIEDTRDILKIYAYYVENTAITFEYDVPTENEFAGRIEHTLKRYPYLVAVAGERIVGYAYAGPLKERAAYGWSVETTVYVEKNERQSGIGCKLYEALENELKRMGILNMYACIADPIEEDAYLTKDSPKFHQRMGFEIIGRFHRCGYKFGRWYNMIWMEKFIGEHKDVAEPVKCYKN